MGEMGEDGSPERVLRVLEDDPRWQDPAQPRGLTRLQREDDLDAEGDFNGGAGEVWALRRPGGPWAGAAVQRWCADCQSWTHVVDAGVPVDWLLDDQCATCRRSFPLDPTACPRPAARRWVSLSAPVDRAR